ncbi:hypothetical protein L3V79_01905 [Thiotrichales bacterium 19S9-12]|nr:hypothetical protein [Thiotrichales bacterium 19S9-11]MCF6811111.1 hypothetical protein [Thiotrichales bacterium 19S9-12]
MRVKTIVTALTAGMIVSGSAMAASSDVDAKIANLQQQLQQLQAQVNGNSGSMKSGNGMSGVSFVKYDANYSQKMLNNQDSGIDRELDILKARQSGQLTSNSIYLGGKGEVQAVYRRMGSVGAGNSNATGNAELKTSNTTSINLPYANVIFTSTIGDWISGYANLSVTNPVTHDVVLPDAYFVLGNLDKSPLYMWGGEKTVDFGGYDMVNTYIPTLSRAAFLAQAGQVGFGFHKMGLTTTITLMNGSGLSDTNTSNQGSTSAISNFAANVKFEQTTDGNFTYHMGAGYINGTGFHGDLNSDRVGAWTTFGGIDVAGLKVMFDYTMTTASVRGINTSADVTSGAVTGGVSGLDPRTASTLTNGTSLYSLPWILGYTGQMTSAFDSGKVVQSWAVNTSYSMPMMGHDTTFFGSYSQLYQDGDNNMYQFTVGARTNVIDTLWVGLNYNVASGKLNAKSLQTSNIIMGDATVYF